MKSFTERVREKCTPQGFCSNCETVELYCLAEMNNIVDQMLSELREEIKDG